MRFSWAILLAVGTVAVASGDEMDDAKDRVTKAEATLKNLQALRAKKIASDAEVNGAELDANRARAALARLNGDEKEEEYREAIVTGVQARVTRMEKLQKIGAVSQEELDLTQRELAASKIDLATLRGQQKTIVAQWRVILAIEERRYARAKELATRGVVPKGELESYHKALDQARQAIKQAGGEN